MHVILKNINSMRLELHSLLAGSWVLEARCINYILITIFSLNSAYPFDSLPILSIISLNFLATHIAYPDVLHVSFIPCWLPFLTSFCLSFHAFHTFTNMYFNSFVVSFLFSSFILHIFCYTNYSSFVCFSFIYFFLQNF